MTHEIKTETIIQAPAHIVWSILTDFTRFPEWNPFIVEIAGKLEVGTRLRARIKPEGSNGMMFTPIVITATPDREFCWRGQLFLPGLMDGVHRFAIEPLEGGGIRFHHEEQFTGILVPLFLKSMEKGTRTSFNTMNASLKARAEQFAAQ